MKKALITAALITGITISTGAVASDVASGSDTVPVRCPAMQQKLAPEMQAKLEQFHKDTSELRRQVVVKRAELRALMHQTSPDPVAVGQLSGKLFDLDATMKEKAREAGVEQYLRHGMRRGNEMGHKGMKNGGGRGHKGMMSSKWQHTDNNSVTPGATNTLYAFNVASGEGTHVLHNVPSSK